MIDTGTMWVRAGPTDTAGLLHVRRLTELSEAGVDQFNLYLMSGDEELQLAAYGSTIIPGFKATLATDAVME